jgi:beta-lactamase regulating signal transducer with metallopeptidase domain
MPFLEGWARLAGTELLVKGTLVLVIGWLGAWMLRRAPAGLRHLVWLSAIVSALLLPALGPVRLLRVAILPGSHAATLGNTPALTGAPIVRAAASYAGPAARAPIVAAHHMNGATIGLVFWACIAGAILIWFGVGELVVHRVLRRARAADADTWADVVQQATSCARLPCTPRLVVSDAVDTAFACNAFVPTIVLPAESEEWSRDRRFAVLLHEMAHVRRRDLVAFAVARLACALYWFHPLVWGAARRLRLESELACDQVVLEHGVRASEYAQHLLDMVTALRMRAPAPSAALAVVRRSEFEGRLVAILDRSVPGVAPSRMRFATLVGSMAVLTLTIAAVQPVRRGASAAAPPLSPNDSRVSHAALGALTQFGTAAIANPLLMLLRETDSLRLSVAQADSIATLNRRYTAVISSIWRPVIRYIRAHSDLDDESLLNGSGFSAARAATAGVLADIMPRVTALLGPSQRARLPADVAPYFAGGGGRGMPASIVDRALTTGPVRGRISGPGR